MLLPGATLLCNLAFFPFSLRHPSPPTLPRHPSLPGRRPSRMISAVLSQEGANFLSPPCETFAFLSETLWRQRLGPVMAIPFWRTGRGWLGHVLGRTGQRRPACLPPSPLSAALPGGAAAFPASSPKLTWVTLPPPLAGIYRQLHYFLTTQLTRRCRVNPPEPGAPGEG